MDTPTLLKRRNFFALGGSIAAAVTLPSVLAGCSSDTNDNGGSEEFPLGSTQIQALGGGLCGAPTYIAKEKGLWADEGLDVELVSGTFQTQKDGLASGQFLVTNGDFQFFPAVEEGLNIQIIGGMHVGCIKLLVPGDSALRSVADLRGKKIGVDEVGGTPWAITALALGDAGIDPSDDAGEVTFAPYDLSTLEEVAARGEVDAIAAWDPFGTIAENNGFRVLVDISTHPLFAERFCCFLYASTQAIEDKPEVVAALLRGWLTAIEWIAENPEEAVDIVTDSSEHEAYIASDDKDLLVDLINSYHYKHDAIEASGDQVRDDALHFVEKLQQIGYLSDATGAEDFVNNLVATITI